MISSLLDIMSKDNPNPTIHMILGTNRPNRGKTIVKVLKERPTPKEDDIPAYENHAIKELNKMLMYGE